MKPIGNKERVLDLQLDLEKVVDRESCSIGGTKQQQPQQVQQQQPPPPPPAQPKSGINDLKAEKPAQFTSFPLPMTIAGWPGGLTSLDTCHHFKLLCPWMGVLDLRRLARNHICFSLNSGQRGAQLVTTLLGASTVISSLQG